MLVPKIILTVTLLFLSFFANAAQFTSAVTMVTAGSVSVNDTHTFTVPIAVAGYYQVLVTEVPAANPACNPYNIGTVCLYNTAFTVNSVKESGTLVPAMAYLSVGIHKISVNSKVAPHARMVIEIPIGFSFYIFSVTGPV